MEIVRTSLWKVLQYILRKSILIVESIQDSVFRP